MKTYDEYRDSGVEWIGEIPVQWSSGRLKYYFRLRSGESPGEVDRTKGSYEVFGANGSIGYTDDFNLSHETILIGRVGSSGEVRLSEPPCWVTDNCLIVVPTIDYDRKFLFHLLHLTNLPSYTTKTSQPLLTGSTIRNIETIFVPLPEQQQIVTYLDHKTSLIDDLIQKKTKKIELLKEYRTSLINQVVTKGLDPDVEMKESGVEWIGEIPVGWEVKKFKHVSEIVTGNTPSKTDGGVYFTERKDGHRWVKPTSLGEFVPVEESVERLTDLGRDQTRVIPEDSVMVCCIGNTIGRFGISGRELSTNQQINSIIPDRHRLSPWYCLFYMISFSWNLIERINSVTLPIMTKSDLLDTPLPLPQMSEQQEIVTYLDQKTTEIDQSIKNEEDKIQLLKEYRQSLISEVVTGKIDVREVLVS